MATHGRSSRAWRNLSERLRKEREPICHLCAEEIDLDLHYNDERAWTLDHIAPVADGGDLLAEENLAPAHRICNARKGMGGIAARPGFSGSREW